VTFAIFAGLLAWFLQGFIEFGLFIPALAWTAFSLAGCLLTLKPGTDGVSAARTRNEFDKTATRV
jgi:hypothetical protein